MYIVVWGRLASTAEKEVAIPNSKLSGTKVPTPRHRLIPKFDEDKLILTEDCCNYIHEL